MRAAVGGLSILTSTSSEFPFYSGHIIDSISSWDEVIQDAVFRQVTSASRPGSVLDTASSTSWDLSPATQPSDSLIRPDPTSCSDRATTEDGGAVHQGQTEA